MLRLIISDTVSVSIKGALSDADGKPLPFDFSIQCKRTGAEQITAESSDQSDKPLKDYLFEKAVGWRNVFDANGAALPFALPAWEAVMDIPGMAGLAMRNYIDACGAKGKEKN